jgi:hypothetical protein
LRAVGNRFTGGADKRERKFDFEYTRHWHELCQWASSAQRVAQEPVITIA